MDLISRSALIERMSDFASFAAVYKPYKSKDDIAEDVLKQAKEQALEMVNEAPTVEAKPVVRGEWVCIEQTTTYYETLIQECCSICGRKLTRTSTQPQVNFCPNCGADMRLKPELVVPTKQMEEALQKWQKELQKSRDKFFFGKKVDE